MNERHPDPIGKIICGFLEPREYTEASFEPTDQPFKNVAVTIRFAIEISRSGIAVFIGFGWDQRFAAEFHNVFVDSIVSVPFVTCQHTRPDDVVAVLVDKVFINTTGNSSITVDSCACAGVRQNCNGCPCDNPSSLYQGEWESREQLIRCGQPVSVQECGRSQSKWLTARTCTRASI